MQSKVAMFFAWFLAITYVSATIIIGMNQWREFKEMRIAVLEMQKDVIEMRKNAAEIKSTVDSIELNIRYIELNTGPQN